MNGSKLAYLEFFAKEEITTLIQFPHFDITSVEKLVSRGNRGKQKLSHLKKRVLFVRHRYMILQPSNKI